MNAGTGPEPDRGEDEPTGELWEEELDEAAAARFKELRASPAKLIQVLREDLPFQLVLARADAVPFLKRRFSSTKGWEPLREGSGPLGPASVGTEWRFEGVHDLDDAFNHTRASGRPVVVRGFTIMSAEAEGFKVRRYVDWAGLYAQLGLTVNWRVPVAAPPRQP